jgi:hypothetical protein
MTTEVRTPLATTAVELSGGGLFRKQILRFDTIDYTDKTGQTRKITFDQEYGRKLVEAFQAGAYEQVPFQLADADNRHTNAPDRTGGEVVGVELSADGTGVDGILRTWGVGHEVVERNPKLGVSARILENATLGGRHFPVALQHVLATVDPQMRNLRPWERVKSVDLSSGTVDEAVDLSTTIYGGSAMPPKEGEGTTTLELSTAQAERLKKLLETDEALEALAEELGPEFFEAVENGEDPEDDEEDEPEPVTELSGVSSEALELANAQLTSQGQAIIELTNRLNAERTEHEIDGYRSQNLAPAVIEAARPLLGIESGAVELSNGVPGMAVDPGEVVREILNTVIELANSGHLLVDPDSEQGSLHGTDPQVGKREAMLKDWANYG